eukprot:SAG11_NODE_19533_length_464_cov_2.156164_1_plen_61_part_01
MCVVWVLLSDQRVASYESFMIEHILLTNHFHFRAVSAFSNSSRCDTKFLPSYGKSLSCPTH